VVDARVSGDCTTAEERLMMVPRHSRGRKRLNKVQGQLWYHVGNKYILAEVSFQTVHGERRMLESHDSPHVTE
jgi:hypothetical protein